MSYSLEQAYLFETFGKWVSQEMPKEIIFFLDKLRRSLVHQLGGQDRCRGCQPQPEEKQRQLIIDLINRCGGPRKLGLRGTLLKIFDLPVKEVKRESWDSGETIPSRINSVIDYLFSIFLRQTTMENEINMLTLNQILHGTPFWRRVFAEHRLPAILLNEESRLYPEDVKLSHIDKIRNYPVIQWDGKYIPLGECSFGDDYWEIMPYVFWHLEYLFSKISDDDFGQFLKRLGFDAPEEEPKTSYICHLLFATRRNFNDVTTYSNLIPHRWSVGQPVEGNLEYLFWSRDHPYSSKELLQIAEDEKMGCHRLDLKEKLRGISSPSDYLARKIWAQRPDNKMDPLPSPMASEIIDWIHDTLRRIWKYLTSLSTPTGLPIHPYHGLASLIPRKSSLRSFGKFKQLKDLDHRREETWEYALREFLIPMIIDLMIEMGIPQVKTIGQAKDLLMTDSGLRSLIKTSSPRP
jgi:hypothetical protein